MYLTVGFDSIIRSPIDIGQMVGIIFLVKVVVSVFFQREAETCLPVASSDAKSAVRLINN